ncbi:anaphase-promoting complex subunit cdc27 [Ascosphaera aggregata]|nr:anaphase-promoting complex subunit cdc27 [Ascosphaera aggregata]
MAPSAPHISTQLRQLIYYQLDNNCLRNALFLAGRLHAFEPRSADASYLLALCHLHCGQSKAALEASKQNAIRGTHLGSAYVYAQACLDLGRHVDGVTALEKCQHLWNNRNTWNKHSETRRQPLPDAAAVLCLQGKLWQAYKNLRKAVDCYVEALRRNPFLWDAFLGLCEIARLTNPPGVDVKVPNIYRMTPSMREMIQTAETDDSLGNAEKVVNFFGIPHREARSNFNGTGGSGNAAGAGAADPFNVFSSTRSDLTNGSALFEKQNGGNVSFPSAMATTPTAEGMETPISKGNASGGGAEDWSMGSSQGDPIFEPPHAPSRKHRTIQAINADYASEPPPKMRAGRTKSHRTRSRTETPEETNAAVTAATSTTASRPTRETSVPASQTQSERERKRTVSGQLVEPQHLQRRSARLGNQVRPTGTRATSSIPTLGVKEPREIKKVRSTSSRSRTTSSSSVVAAAAAAAAVGSGVSGTLRRTASNSSKGIPEIPEDIPSGSGIGAAAGSGMSWTQPHQQAVNNSMKSSHQQQQQLPAAPQPTTVDRTKDIAAVYYILDLFSKLAGGCFALSRYMCREAIQMFNSLPAAQRDAPWVLAQYGKAYYEQAMYQEAEKYFARVRANAPAMLDDMEIYSTVLWHLKDEVELAYLAHELMDIDRLSPEAWCAIGNSFSLQQEHDQALKCFKRATQLDPHYAYGFTLQGHEYVANEEHDKALDAYRQAIATNSRLYNAWYGLGKVYERLGKLDHALRHFHAACSINPTNSVLVTCIAALHERAGDYEAAELQSIRSVNLAPQSVYARLRKARVLMKLRKLNEALAELMVLKDMAPDEVQVYELMGRLYKMTGDKGNMIKHFTTAMNLDPRAAQYLKETMENSDDDFFDNDYETMT